MIKIDLTDRVQEQGTKSTSSFPSQDINDTSLSIIMNENASGNAIVTGVSTDYTDFNEEAFTYRSFSNENTINIPTNRPIRINGSLLYCGDGKYRADMVAYFLDIDGQVQTYNIMTVKRDKVAVLSESKFQVDFIAISSASVSPSQDGDFNYTYGIIRVPGGVFAVSVEGTRTLLGVNRGSVKFRYKQSSQLAYTLSSQYAIAETDAQFKALAANQAKLTQSAYVAR